MDVGVVSRSFPDKTNAQVARLLADNGFRWTELCFSQTDSNFWVYNGRSDISALTNDRSAEIVEIYRSHGVEVPVIGVFTNLLEPDDDELHKNLLYFERHMEIAACNKVPSVATECGFIPGQRGVQQHTFESAFARFVNTFQWLAKRAEEYEVDVVLEPCVLDIVPSAKRTVDFINQVGSPRVRVLLDPANLIANNSETEMFEQLSPHIAYFHGKDRKVNDAAGRVVGDGEIDWPKFLSMYRDRDPETPFILEYVNIDNFCAIRDRVIEFAAQ